jgi:cyanophycinase-like exopeptidase
MVILSLSIYLAINQSNQSLHLILISLSFIGDAYEYISIFSNSPSQTAIQDKISDITLSGTGGGTSILGGWIYTAENGQVSSQIAMNGPYGNEVLLGSSLWKIPYLNSIILDTNFVTMNRMGRLLTFVARIIQDNGTETGGNEDLNIEPSSIYYNTYGIGIDENTALILNINNGDINIIGTSSSIINICSPHNKAETCASNTPLTMKEIVCTRLNTANQYNLNNFNGDGIIYDNNIVSGTLNDDPYGQNAHNPTSQPSSAPTSDPTSQPSCQPSGEPTSIPSGLPTSVPSAPTASPTSPAELPTASR